MSAVFLRLNCIIPTASNTSITQANFQLIDRSDNLAAQIAQSGFSGKSALSALSAAFITL
jgi:hypothetical protein